MMSSASKILILDEWVWADLGGENGKICFEETYEFINSVYKKCDKIATMKGSKFERKFFNLCKRTDINCHTVIRIYKNYIFHNLDKYISLNEEDCQQIPQDILSEVNIDDHYLLKLQYRLQCSIITTDNQLLGILRKHQIPSDHRDNFIRHYNTDGNRSTNDS